MTACFNVGKDVKVRICHTCFNLMTLASVRGSVIFWMSCSSSYSSLSLCADDGHHSDDQLLSWKGCSLKDLAFVNRLGFTSYSCYPSKCSWRCARTLIPATVLSFTQNMIDGEGDFHRIDIRHGSELSRKSFLVYDMVIPVVIVFFFFLDYDRTFPCLVYLIGSLLLLWRRCLPDWQIQSRTSLLSTVVVPSQISQRLGGRTDSVLIYSCHFFVEELTTIVSSAFRFSVTLEGTLDFLQSSGSV